MSGVIPAILVGSLLTLDFLLILAAYSLRGFSRSRLSEICSERGQSNRFGDILKGHQQTLFAVELYAAGVLIVLVGFGHAWLAESFAPITDPLSAVLLVGRILFMLAILLGVVVVFPWTLARVAGEQILCRLWPLLNVLTMLARPVLSLSERLDRLIHRIAGRELPDNDDAETLTDEIRTVVDEGQREGLIESEAGSMIQRVMELRKDDTASIMTPRTDMVCIRVDCSIEEAREQLLQAGHSRIPVIGDTTDDIVGILYAKDLLKYLKSEETHPETTLRQIVREPYYVPETTGIDTLLENMKRKRVHLAIVVDEYGGVAGLVSMEDILEEIVGEIVDEYDSALETGISMVSPDVIEVESRVHIDDLNEQFDCGLPEDGDYETIGGFVFHELGRVPTNGETFVWNQLRFTVKSADQRRIHKLQIVFDKTLATTSTDET
ncbi:MAG: hemolysin family protein [Planctomycetaceae bacterium]